MKYLFWVMDISINCWSNRQKIIQYISVNRFIHYNVLFLSAEWPILLGWDNLPVHNGWTILTWMPPGLLGPVIGAPYTWSSKQNRGCHPCLETKGPKENGASGKVKEILGWKSEGSCWRYEEPSAAVPESRRSATELKIATPWLATDFPWHEQDPV